MRSVMLYWKNKGQWFSIYKQRKYVKELDKGGVREVSEQINKKNGGSRDGEVGKVSLKWK